MSWNDRKIFQTVKFRVALWYAVLFALSAAISFLLVFIYLKNSMLRQTDHKLTSYADRVLYDYLTNNKFKRFDREVPLGKVSAEAMGAMKRRIPNLKPLLAFERGGRKLHYYTVIGYADEKLYELRLESGGTVFTRLIQTADHLPLVRKGFQNMVAEEGSSNLFFRLLSPQGRVIAQSPLPQAFPENITPDLSNRFYTVSGNPPFRVMTEQLFDGNILEIGRSLHYMQRRLELYSLIFFSTIGTILCLGTLCGWLIARKFIAGVERLNAAAQHIIQSGDFSKRVPVEHDGVEIDDLVRAFNSMNANTEKLITELQHITDDIAHDLRTPLTRMRGMAEVTVSGPQELAQYREMACDVAEECTKMVAMINTMLEITRTESNLETISESKISLNELLEQAYDLYQLLAEEKGQTFSLNLPEDTVMISADKIKIQRIVANLLDNAIKFTPAGGFVTLDLSARDGMAEIRICDTGCGIPEKDLENIFKRFYRADSSRTLPGNGLGLSLVHAIVEAHHGKISVASSEKGSIFTVCLPLC